MALGSNQGNTYTGHEGVDLAFSLAYQPNLTDIRQQFARSRKKKEVAQQQKAAGSEKLAKWNNERPDFFWAHDQEKQKQLNDLYDWGSKLMEAGVKDPTTSSNPKAIEFQKAMGNIKAIAKESKAIEERYNKDRQAILADKKKVYKDKSKQDLLDWYEKTPLDKIVKEGLLPPKLEYNNPEVSITASVEALAKNMADGAPIDQFIEAGKGIIVDDQPLTDKVSQVIGEMTPIAQQTLKDEATAVGLDPDNDLSGYYLGKLAKLRKYNKPEDFNKLVDELVDYQAGYVTKEFRSEKETGGGDTKTTSGRTKEVPFTNSLGVAKSKVAMLDPGQKDRFMGKSYVTYATKSDGTLDRDKHGALVPTGTKVVKDDKGIEELIAYRNALENAYDKKSGTDLQLAGKQQDWRGWGKKKNEDYDVWQKSLMGQYPEGGSAELRRTNQQRAISWLNGLEIDGYKVKNGSAEYSEGGVVKYGDEWWNQIISEATGKVGYVVPEEMNITFERYSKGRAGGYESVQDEDPYTMNLFSEKSANTGLTRTWYSKQFDANNLFFKPATEEDKMSQEQNDGGSLNMPTNGQKNSKTKKNPVKKSTTAAAAAWDNE